MTSCAKNVPVALLLASSRQGTPCSKGKRTSHKTKKIVTLYDEVFIQQSILEVGLRFLGTPCIGISAFNY